MHSISIIIPAYNSGEQLTECLQAIRGGSLLPLETIVVDDSSTDDTRRRAVDDATQVLDSGGRRGPGFARNLGAREASGDILFFVDSDVCVWKDTIERIAHRFDSDPTLDAVIGSYDRSPRCWDFLSQYRNLMHAYVHQSGEAHASTFWTGCGAVRRSVFLEHGGFDESRPRPSIEDIELGYRMRLNGRNLMLDRNLLVTHLKRWTLWTMIKTDILDRGIPWTDLILSSRFMPNDLNLRFSQRISVLVAFFLAAVTGVLVAQNGVQILIPLLAIVLLMLAGWWTEIRNLVRPLQALILLSCFVAVLAQQTLSHHMYLLCMALLLSPAFLLLMRPSYRRDATPAWSYLLCAFYIVGSLGVAAITLPASPLLLLWLVLIIMLCLLNARFYLFIKQERRMIFMIAVIPLHFLHHFYNGISFVIGLTRYCLAFLRRCVPRFRVAS